MNWLLIVILAVLVIFVIHGFYKGFIRIIFSLISIILVIAFIAWSTPYISDFLENNTPIYNSIQQKCETHIHEKVEANTEESIENSADVLVVAGITLPTSIQKRLIDESVGAADELLESTGLYTQVANTMAGFMVTGIAFLIALLAALVVMHIIGKLLNLFSKLPIIRGINRFLGLFAGLIQGLIVVWIFMYLVAVCCTNNFGQIMTGLINQSHFLTYLYNNNGVLQFAEIFF